MSDSQAPSALSGQYNTVVGNIKETYGAAVGSSDIEAAGRDQAAQGDVEQKAAQASAYAEGVANNLGGKVDRLVGAALGDQEKMSEGEKREQQGKKQQEANA